MNIKAFLLLTYVLSFISTFSQSWLTQYEPNTENLAKYELQGSVRSMTKIEKQLGEHPTARKFEYTFNKEGNLILKKSYSDIGEYNNGEGNYAYNGQTEYKYNEVGKEIIRISYHASGEESYRITSSYENGNLMRYEGFGLLAVFTYGTDGKIQLKTVTSTEQNYVKQKEMYSYFQNKYLLVKYFYNSDGSLKNQEEYTYNSKTGQLLSEKKNNSETNYTYDTQGFLIQESSSKGDWVTYYNNNSNGDPVMSFRFKKVNGELVYQKSQMHNSILDKPRMILASNGKNYSLCSYDSQGNILQLDYYKHTETDGDLLQQQHEFIYSYY